MLFFWSFDFSIFAPLFDGNTFLHTSTINIHFVHSHHLNSYLVLIPIPPSIIRSLPSTLTQLLRTLFPFFFSVFCNTFHTKTLSFHLHCITVHTLTRSLKTLDPSLSTTLFSTQRHDKYSAVRKCPSSGSVPLDQIVLLFPPHFFFFACRSFVLPPTLALCPFPTTETTHGAKHFSQAHKDPAR